MLLYAPGVARSIDLPLIQSAIGAVVVLIGVFIVLNSNNKSVHQTKQSVYDELINTGNDVKSAAARKNKKVKNTINKKLADINDGVQPVVAQVQNAARQAQSNVKQQMSKVDEQVSDKVSDNSSKKNKPKKKSTAKTKSTNQSPPHTKSTNVSNDYESDDDDTIDIDNLINVQQAARQTNSKQSHAAAPVVSQPYVKRPSESEIARIEAQNKLKSEAEAKAKRAAEQKLQQQHEKDAQDGWTLSQTQASGSVSKKANDSENNTHKIFDSHATIHGEDY